MAVIKCKMCGGDLVIEPGATVAECEYCGTKQTIPNQDDEKKLTLFARANRLRMGCEFDKAAGIYESIVADFPPGGGGLLGFSAVQVRHRVCGRPCYRQENSHLPPFQLREHHGGQRL